MRPEPALPDHGDDGACNNIRRGSDLESNHWQNARRGQH
jgi:hypothetical protein